MKTRAGPLALALVRPGGVLAFALVLSPAPGRHVLGGSQATLQPLPAKLSAYLPRLIARLREFLTGPGVQKLSASSVKTEDVFFPLLCVSLPQKAGCASGRPSLSRLAAREELVPNQPGRDSAGLRGFRPPTASWVPPGHSSAFSPFPSPSSCTHSGSGSARLPRRAASLPRASQG